MEDTMADVNTPANVVAPPSYNAATDPEAAPPSYDSLFGEIRDVKSPKGFVYVVRKGCGVFMATIGYLILTCIGSVLPIAMIVIERYIPLYLIVGGAFGVVKTVMNFFYSAKQRRNKDDVDPTNASNPNPFDGVLNCFLLGWFIAGSVWVYRIYKPDFDDEESSNYCNKTVYLTAFVVITLQYAILCAVVAGFCCCCCCIACWAALKEPDQTEATTA